MQDNCTFQLYLIRLHYSKMFTLKTIGHAKERNGILWKNKKDKRDNMDTNSLQTQQYVPFESKPHFFERAAYAIITAKWSHKSFPFSFLFYLQCWSRYTRKYAFFFLLEFFVVHFLLLHSIKKRNRIITMLFLVCFNCMKHLLYRYVANRSKFYLFFN